MFVVMLTSIAACEAATVVTVGPGPGCPKVPVEAVLHVSRGDPRQVWATDLATGNVLAVRPRAELRWRVDPSSDRGQLVAPNGQVATFEGEIFREACFDAFSNTYYIGPEDLPDPNRGPN